MSGEAVDDTLGVLARHYRHLGPIIGELRQPRGNEINSRNIVVQTASGTVVVKRLAGEGDGATENTLTLAEQLRSKGLPLPDVKPSDAGTRTVTDVGYEWHVLEFVPGRYFEGGAAQVPSVATTIRRLRQELEGVGPWEDPLGPIGVPDEDDLRLLDEFASLRARWDALVGPSHAETLSRGWPLMRDSLLEVLRVREELLRVQGPCHIDLHPHNLLMQGDEVAAILDLASLRSAPVPVMGAFAAYKLLRHAAAMRGLRDDHRRARELATLFLDALRPAEGTGIDPAVGAQSEILRRLVFVLRAVLQDGEREWLHVIPVHLAGLLESEILLSDRRPESRRSSWPEPRS